MSTITVDSTWQSILGEMKDVTEIRDGQGNVLGFFTPKHLAEEHSLYEKAKQLFDHKEHDRRLREESGKGVPLEEFWKRIEAQKP